MSSPTLVAIIPSIEWREALLGDGVCGSRAPRIYHYDEHGWEYTRPVVLSTWVKYSAKALPLIWQGEPVPDAVGRALHAGWDFISMSEANYMMDPSDGWYGENRIRVIVQIAREMEDHGMGRAVIEQ